MNRSEIGVGETQAQLLAAWQEGQIIHTDGSSHLLGRLSLVGYPEIAALSSYYIKPTRRGIFSISPLTMAAAAPTYQTNALSQRFENGKTDPADISTILEVINSQRFGKDNFFTTWIHTLLSMGAGHLFLPDIQTSIHNRERIQFYYKDIQGYPLRSSVYHYPEGDTIENLISQFVLPQQQSLAQLNICVQPYSTHSLAGDVKGMPAPSSQVL